nr:hypothetical protein [Tanacetum cinerariifolium]
MQDYYRLSNELTKAVRMKDGYINELQMLASSNEVVESIEIMRRVQVDAMETALRLMLMTREMQTKVHEKNNFIVRLRNMYSSSIKHAMVSDNASSKKMVIRWTRRPASIDRNA